MNLDNDDKEYLQAILTGHYAKLEKEIFMISIKLDSHIQSHSLVEKDMINMEKDMNNIKKDVDRNYSKTPIIKAVGLAFPLSSLASINNLLAINFTSSPPSIIRANQ